MTDFAISAACYLAAMLLACVVFARALDWLTSPAAVAATADIIAEVTHGYR